MRKTLSVVLLTAVLLVGLIPAASADVKPNNVPHVINSSDEGFSVAFGASTFTDLWEELDGVGVELPQTGAGGRSAPAEVAVRRLQSDDDLVRGPAPIGFTFQYMNGPVEPAPGWPPADWKEWWTGDTAPPFPEKWPSALSDRGYTEVYVATNGFIVFADKSTGERRPLVSANTVPDAQQPGLGSWNWWPWQVPIAEPPNNFVAPYWTDLAIGGNDYFRVAQVCREQTDNLWDDEHQQYVPVYSYLPCEWQMVERPRGRLLYATLGTAPNRKFVVEWLNARNHWTGFLTTFELQLFEGSNAILFLYKDFQTKDEGQVYFEVPSVVIGMEDWFGTTGVGQAYVLDGPRPFWNELDLTYRVSVEINKPSLDQDGIPAPYGAAAHVPPPMSNGDMVGFVY
jgi:hypothetical protein